METAERATRSSWKILEECIVFTVVAMIQGGGGGEGSQSAGQAEIAAVLFQVGDARAVH